MFGGHHVARIFGQMTIQSNQSDDTRNCIDDDVTVGVFVGGHCTKSTAVLGACNARHRFDFRVVVLPANHDF
jgi:hypothetical protein